MNPLCISNINLRSPYAVWEENGEYVFISENNILYAIGFNTMTQFVMEHFG